MKKWTAILLTVISAFLLAACSGGESQEDSGQEPSDNAQVSEEEVPSETDESASTEEEAVSGGAAEESADTNMLVAYFSYAENADLPEGVDVSSGASIQIWNDETTGNTGVVAAMIADTAGADMFSIRTAEKYPDTYDATIDQGQEEQNADARPELASHIENMDSYDVIFLGYPNWWYGVPMALLSFLEENDLSGKQVYLFCSHGTGGLAASVDIITEALPDAEISDNIFDCYEEDASSSEEVIRQWVDELGYSAAESADPTPGEAAEQNILNLQVGDTVLTAQLADNSSADALRELLLDGPLEIAMQDYGDMEKVGSLGQDLPTNDEQITTEAGDLILYQGNSFVIYYAPNSWNFTRLGKINDITAEELQEILGESDVTVTLSLPE